MSCTTERRRTSSSRTATSSRSTRRPTEGNLLPGDICTYVSIGHTNVYAGNGLWYEFGRCALNGKYVDNEYVFDSFGPVAAVNMSDTKIGTIIRLVK